MSDETWWRRAAQEIGRECTPEAVDRLIAKLREIQAAAPTAASVRARGLVWTVDTEDGFESHTAEVNAPNINYFEVGPSQKGFYAKAEHSQDRDATWYGTQFPSIEAAKAACYEAWNAYVRTLLAPAVDERAASSEPEMCPNCVTPWKCNGPHEFPQAASSEAAVAFDAERFERAPCYLCGYNGRGYYQPETHPCAAKYHAHPAPTTADAGVTEATLLVRFWRNRYISELTLRIRNRGVNLEVAIAEAEHVANEAERALKAALARAGEK